jgi:hypothetical protein
MKTVFECGGSNPFKDAKTKSMISVQQSESGRRLFTVTYGLQQDKGLTYSQACDYIGRAILHDACCNGDASNEGA